MTKNFRLMKGPTDYIIVHKKEVDVFHKYKVQLRAFSNV